MQSIGTIVQYARILRSFQVCRWKSIQTCRCKAVLTVVKGERLGPNIVLCGNFEVLKDCHLCGYSGARWTFFDGMLLIYL
jgi:hypothetical protein